MKLQTALDLIDDMMRIIDREYEARRNNCGCTDRSYYDEMDAVHCELMARLETLPTAIKNRQIDYS